MRMELLLETPLEIEVRSEETRPAKPKKPERRRKIVRIKTKEKCPKCKRNFQHSENFGLICKRCFTKPSRYYIYLSWQGRKLKIYSFRDGQPLSSWELAQRACQLISHEIENRTFDPSKWVRSDLEKFRVHYLVERYIEDRKDEIKYSSLKKKKVWLKLFVEQFGQKDVRDLRAIHIQEFYEEIRQSNRSSKTIKNILTEVRAFLNWCERLEIIEKVPAFPKVSVREPVIKWIDRETQQKLLEAIPPQHQDIFLFLFTYGCRPSEARALAWDCVNFTERLVIFKRTFSDRRLVETPKGGKIFALPMTEEIYEMLKRRYESQRHPFFVFYHRDRLGRVHHYGEVTLSRIFKKAREKIGLTQDITLYQAARHSFAMQRLAEGFTLGEISAVLRHSSLETIKHYARYRTEQLLPVIEGKIIPLRPRKTESK